MHTVHSGGEVSVAGGSAVARTERRRRDGLGEGWRRLTGDKRGVEMR